MTELGIPYAFHAKDARGNIRPNAVVCPVCSRVIKLKKRKDFESYSNDVYAKHYAKAHAQKESKP